MYEITLRDKINLELNATCRIKVPLKFTPKSENIIGGDLFDLIIEGADEGAQICQAEFLDGNSNIISQEQILDYGILVTDIPIYFDEYFKAVINIQGAIVTELKMFQIGVTVTGDVPLEESCLNVAQSGRIRVFPTKIYSGIVQNEFKVPIPNATVIFKLGNIIQAKTTTTTAPGEEGKFSVELPSFMEIPAVYDVIVMAENYLAFNMIAENWDLLNGETIELTAASYAISGQVTEEDGVTGIEGAMVECLVDDIMYTTYSATDGSYTLFIPKVSDDLPPGQQVRASKTNYMAQRLDVQNTLNFQLNPLLLIDNKIEINTDGGTIRAGSAEAPCIVDIPADSLGNSAILEIDPYIAVSQESAYTMNSVVLVKINVTGADININNPIQVTMPFDITNVNPGDFKTEKAVIYYSDNTDNLKNGIEVNFIPVSDIIYEDHLNGLVSFWVKHTTVFGAGILVLPIVNTGLPTITSLTTVTLNGIVNPNGRDTIWYFEYGTDTSYGETTSPTDAGAGTSDVMVSMDISGLFPNYGLPLSNCC